MMHQWGMAVHATGICYSYYNITYQLAMDVRIVWSGFELDTTNVCSWHLKAWICIVKCYVWNAMKLR